jgi:hypothetical protein
MADNDDHQTDFDDAFADEQSPEPPRRRFGRPRREPGSDDPHAGATGEVERPRATGKRGRGSGSGRGSSSGRGSRRPRRGSRAAGAGSAGSFLQNPRARLGLAVLFAIILVLVITLVVRDCQRSQLESSYNSYLNSVAQVVQTSADQGRDLREVLSNTEGLRPPQVRERIQAVANEADALVAQVEDLSPPGSLSQSQASLITLLQYRVTGLSNLAADLPTLLQSDEEDFTANGIAAQMQRFLASDVIYEDSFAAPARRTMEEDGITGVEVPRLQPFLANPLLVTTDGAKSLLPGLRRTAAATADDGTPTDGNLRGNALVQTEVLPAGVRLSPTSVTTVEASENLKWRVTVRNSGDFVENDVMVTATFSYPSSPSDAEVREASIPVIEPGQEIGIELAGPSQPDYREQGNLVIEIAAVPGEANLDNNKAEYPIRIAL